jgi:hypothetical protein
MSSNPEQIPKSSESNVPHSGEYVSPNALPIEEGIPAPDTAYAGFDELPPQDHERSAIDQGKAAVRDSHATEAKPDKKKLVNRGLMIAGGVGATAVAGLLVATSIFMGNAKEGSNNNANTLPPAPETTNSAPGIPVPAPEITNIASNATSTPERTQGAVVIKFFDETGAATSKEELSDSVKLSINKYVDPVAAQAGFFEEMETMMNHLPSEAEARNNLGYPADKELTKEDYLAAGRIYRDAYKVLYTAPSGPLYDSMENYAEYVIENHYNTRNEDQPYRVSFETGADGYISMLDNSLKNSADDQVETLRFIVDQGAVQQSQGAWLMPGDARFKKS